MEDALSPAGIPAPAHPLFGGRRAFMAGTVVLQLGIGFLDYITGWEPSLSIFYSGVILLVAMNCDRSFATAFVIITVLIWWCANSTVHPYQSSWGFTWATINRTGQFTFFAVGGAALKTQRDAVRARLRALDRARELETEIVRVSEREQQRIGQDLHDGLCQQLAAIGCATRSLADDLHARSLPEAREAEKIEELLRDTVVQTRNLARGIFPVVSDGAGLATALMELAATAKGLTGMEVSFREEGEVQVDDPEVAMHLYRIAQEALNNALRHSHGRQVVISLRREGGIVRLTVGDDGSGLPGSPDTCAGMGLRTMEYRARSLGAALEIRRQSPRGTLVSCAYDSARTSPHARLS